MKLAHDALRDDGREEDAPPQFTASSAFGSVKPAGKSQEFDEQIRDAKEERAENLVRAMGYKRVE